MRNFLIGFVTATVLAVGFGAQADDTPAPTQAPSHPVVTKVTGNRMVGIEVTWSDARPTQASLPMADELAACNRAFAAHSLARRGCRVHTRATFTSFLLMKRSLNYAASQAPPVAPPLADPTTIP